jgi:hypothetical protein
MFIKAKAEYEEKSKFKSDISGGKGGRGESPERPA